MSLQPIQLLFMENTECLIIKARLSYKLKVGVLLDHGVSSFFVLLSALWKLWATFQAKNNVKSVPPSTALVLQ